MNDLLQLKKPLTSGTPVTQTADLESKKSINHHKRPSISYEISSKRAKCQHDNGTLKSTPQLLQQLITTSSGVNSSKARQRVQMQSIKSEPIRYIQPTSQSLLQQNKQSQPQQASSNSVLMNLLVSGCDVSAGYYTTCLPRPKVAKA